jgi:hypothetical protein
MIGRLVIVLIGSALAGMVGTSCWYYRRSKRMSHILPLGLSYLALVLLTLYGFWTGYRAWWSWDGIVLSASYITGALGLGFLLAKSRTGMRNA